MPFEGISPSLLFSWLDLGWQIKGAGLGRGGFMQMHILIACQLQEHNGSLSSKPFRLHAPQHGVSGLCHLGLFNKCLATLLEFARVPEMRFWHLSDLL